MASMGSFGELMIVLEGATVVVGGGGRGGEGPHRRQHGLLLRGDRQRQGGADSASTWYGTAMIVGMMPFGSEITLLGAAFLGKKNLIGCFHGSTRQRVDMPRLLN